MSLERGQRWFQRPVPTLLLGIVAFGIAAFGATAWLDDQNRLGGLVGTASGAIGVWLTVGALIGIRDRRSR